jgi:hypothetical protein
MSSGYDRMDWLCKKAKIVVTKDFNIPVIWADAATCM